MQYKLLNALDVYSKQELITSKRPGKNQKTNC